MPDFKVRPSVNGQLLALGDHAHGRGVNLLIDPSFELPEGNFAWRDIVSAGTGSTSRQADTPRHGGQYQRLTLVSEPTSGPYRAKQQRVPWAYGLGQPVTFSIDVRGSLSGADAYFVCFMRDASDILHATRISPNLALTSGWQRVTWVIDPMPTDATSTPVSYDIELRLHSRAASASGTFDFDAAHLELGASATVFQEDVHPTDVVSVRAHAVLTGGGVIAYGNDELSWTSRFIVIDNGRSRQFAGDGFFNIEQPPSGTVVKGVGGVGDGIVTSTGVPLGTWQALYYVLPLGGLASSVPGNFRRVYYTADAVIPAHWILIAVQNAELNYVRLATGHVLKPGQSITAGAQTAFGGNPVALGGVTTGTDTRPARADHVHPTDGLALLGHSHGLGAPSDARGGDASSTTNSYHSLNGPTQAFTAPPSGIVMLIASTICRNGPGGNTAFFSPRVLDDTGAQVFAPGDGTAGGNANQHEIATSVFVPVTGLTPGASYTAEIMYRSNGSTTSYWRGRRLVVMGVAL